MAPRPDATPGFDSPENTLICLTCPCEVCILDGGQEPCPIGALQPWKYRMEAERNQILGSVLAALYERGEPMTSEELAEVTGYANTTIEKYCRDGVLLFEGRPKRIIGVRRV